MLSLSQEQDILRTCRSWRRKAGGPGGHWPSPLGFKVSKFQAILCYLGNIASKFWAISYFSGKFASKFRGNLIFIKPSQFQWRPFFFGDHLNLHRKTDHFPGKIQCHFSGKSLMPPQILLSSYANACRLQSQGLELRSQWLQNVFSGTPPLI